MPNQATQRRMERSLLQDGKRPGQHDDDDDDK